MESKPIRFSRLLEQHILKKVNKQFTNQSLDPPTLRAIRDLIRNEVCALFNKSSHRLTETAQFWVANQIFRNIKIGTPEGMTPINELVIINEYKLTDMPYSDIELMRNLFGTTTMGPELEEEYRRRNVA